MEMDFTVESAKDFDATVAAVIAETEAAKFRVQFVHDVAATLAEKGFERERVTIVELCNARHAHAVLAADVKIGLMLPCPIMVYAEGTKVMVSTMRPTLIADFFPNADLGTAPAEVEAAVCGIVERAAAA
ncbi:MAG TPA: DUF302 domain-containing protein [Coriobacteriia bacterium]|nr:DUF302 domain-containing protein [Coriobacteriia bacterium]